jgi:transketolase
MSTVPGVDFSTGSLGQGLSVGLGMAIALRNSGPMVWVVLGDGECQEGQIWEAAMMAQRYHVDNLCAIIDYNKYQEWGWEYNKDLCTDPVINMKQKWIAFGWNVFETNGHDYGEMMKVFSRATSVKGSPSVVIAHTIKGKGFSIIEADPIRFHCSKVEPGEQEKLEGSIC